MRLESNPSSVYKQLVVTLSYEGHYVIDATLGNGTSAYV